MTHLQVTTTSTRPGPFASPIACGLALNSICNKAAVVGVVVALAVRENCCHITNDTSILLLLVLWLLALFLVPAFWCLVVLVAGTISGDSVLTVCANRNRIELVEPQLKCRFRRSANFFGLWQKVTHIKFNWNRTESGVLGGEEGAEIGRGLLPSHNNDSLVARHFVWANAMHGPQGRKREVV